MGMITLRVFQDAPGVQWSSPDCQVEGLNLTVDPSTFHVPDMFGKPRAPELEKVVQRMKCFTAYPG